jgi:crossover junction endodeoxyribonuclease RuvC
MRVLGVDPGLTRCGLGVVDRAGTQELTMAGVGVIQTSTEANLELRLLHLESGLQEWITKFKPDLIAVERVFSQLNVRTAMATGQAAGVALLLAAKAGIPVVMHTPTQVKSAVTGSGRADKKQVALMVQKILKLESIPKPVDSTDALALAICQQWRGRTESLLDQAVRRERARLTKLGSR